MDHVQTLWAEWHDLSTSLPARIDFDSYSHKGEYPENVEHETQIVALLEDARNSAQSELKRGNEALTWLQRLAEQRLVVDRCCGELATRENEIVRLLERVSSSTTPLGQHPSDSDKLLIADLEMWHSHMTQAELEKPNLFQRSNIVGMKYRAIHKNPPPFLHFAAGQHDNLSSRLDDLHEAVSAKIAELRQASSRMQRDREVASLAIEIQEAGRTIEVELEAVSSEIELALKLALWDKGRKMSTSGDLSLRTTNLDKRLQSDLVLLLGQLETLIENDVRYAPILSDCLSAVVTARSALSQIHRNQALLERAIAQTRAVESIQIEADRLLDDMQDGVLESATSSKIEADVKRWLDDIASRVPFLSTSQRSLPSDKDSTASARPHMDTTKTPSTPPTLLASPPPSSELGIDLETTDHAVRDEINSLTAKVLSALDQLRTAGSPELIENPSTEEPERSSVFQNQGSGLETGGLPANNSSGKVPVTRGGPAPSDRAAAPSANDIAQKSRPRSIASIGDPDIGLPLTTPTRSQLKSVSLGRAAGKSYSLRREPSISNELLSRTASSTITRYAGVSTGAPNATVLARSTSTRSFRLGRSITSIPLARRVLSASSTSSSAQSRIPSPRTSTTTPRRSARKYVPDPASKLDVAVGDIVNGFKVSPIPTTMAP
jgi:hypothetical protein